MSSAVLYVMMLMLYQFYMVDSIRQSPGTQFNQTYIEENDMDEK